jgi:hypothetical protein
VVDVLTVNIVILNWLRPVWESDQEVEKMSGRQEPMWVAIHMCMEAMLEISLYSYLYFKLAKTLCLSYYSLCFLFNKIGYKSSQQDMSGRGSVRGEVAQRMYTRVSKYKNDKIK